MNTQENTGLMAFYYEGYQVRKVEIDGNPWFVAKDVCDILGLGNVTEALRNLDEDEKNTLRNSEGIHEGPGNPNVNIINESGLYNLIFRSNKPDAKTFRKWVTSEVLPSIRRNGFYLAPEIMEKVEKLPELFRNFDKFKEQTVAAYKKLESQVELLENLRFFIPLRRSI